jgi:hypothetical protein
LCRAREGDTIPGWGKLLTSGFSLAYNFDVVAWQDWQGDRHGGLPGRPQDAKGLKVLVTGSGEDTGDVHQFWTYNLSRKNSFQDWSEWWVLIGSLMVGHGMELEDEPGEYDE